MLPTKRYCRLSPVEGSITWDGRWADDSEITNALDRAERNLVAWSRTPLDTRIEIARQYALVLETHRENIARAITLESGKPLWESRQEIALAKTKVENSIAAIQQRRSDWSDQGTPVANSIRFQSIGVVLVLGPFNLPLHLPGAHIVPALLAGNVVVFKPSEKTPAVGDWIDRCWVAAGLPNGVLQTLHGGVDVAKKIIDDLRLAGVFFTGSYRSGLAIHRMLAGRPECLLALEMGGNNPLVIDSIEDRRAATEVIIQSCYITSGQRCTCARRLIVVESPENRKLMDQVAQSIARIRVGNPLADQQPFMGCLVSDEAGEQILQLQERLMGLEGKALVKSQSLARLSMLTPGLIEVDNQRLADEEHFGPIATVSYASDFDTAIELAKQTKYGLSAALLSTDRSKFETFVQSMPVGICNWNSPTTGASGKMPFGGTGASGNHRPSGYFAADYCSYPRASVESSTLKKAEKLPPGLEEI